MALPSWGSSIRTALLFCVLLIGGIVAGLGLSAMEAVTGGRLRTGKHSLSDARAAAQTLATCPVCASGSIEPAAEAHTYHCSACGWSGRTLRT